MTATTFDAIAAARALEATGLERQQAEAIVNTVRESASTDRGALATKGDLAELRGELRADIAGVEGRLRADLAGLETRLYRAMLVLAVALVGAQVAIVSLLTGGGQ